MQNANGDLAVRVDGGIETHPETGCAKLNIPTMRPNLAYLRVDGEILQTLELEPTLNKNSIRHLTVAADGKETFQNACHHWVHIVSLRDPDRASLTQACFSPCKATVEAWRSVTTSSRHIPTRRDHTRVQRHRTPVSEANSHRRCPRHRSYTRWICFYQRRGTGCVFIEH